MRRQVITIQTPVQSTDDYGGPVYTWSDYAEVWAEVDPLQGRELIAAKAAQSEVTTLFKEIRYIEGVTPDMRIVYGGVNYNIVSVIDVRGRGVKLEILAKTGLNEG